MVWNILLLSDPRLCERSEAVATEELDGVLATMRAIGSRSFHDWREV